MTFHRQLLPHPVGELLELLEDVAPLGSEIAVPRGDIEQAAEPVVLGFEEVGGVIKSLSSSYRHDRLDQRQREESALGHRLTPRDGRRSAGGSASVEV